MIDDYAELIHANARLKGFYDELDMTSFNSQAKQLAMIHSEVSETLEALRKQKGAAVVYEEIADIMIRCLDFAEALKVNEDYRELSLEQSLLDKMNINKTRQRLHGVLG